MKYPKFTRRIKKGYKRRFHAFKKPIAKPMKMYMQL